MSRQEKLAIYTIVVVLLSAAAVGILLFYGVRTSHAVAGVGVLGALAARHFLFRRKEGPGMDERDIGFHRIAALSAFSLAWTVLLVPILILAMRDTMLPALPSYLLLFVLWAVVYATEGSYAIAVLFLYRLTPRWRPWRRKLIFIAVVLVYLVPAAVCLRLAAGRIPRVEFGGDELAEWHIVSREEILVTSHITLTRWKEGADTITVHLPYEEAALVSVSYSASTNRSREGRWTAVPRSGAIEFKRTGEATYALHLPPDFLAFSNPVGHYTRIHATWRLPFHALDRYEDDSKWGPYIARLSTLVPSQSYGLKVVLEPGCGFTMLNGMTHTENFPCLIRRGDGGYTTNIGTCALCIEPIQPEESGK